jgi:hypothetical protein
MAAEVPPVPAEAPKAAAGLPPKDTYYRANASDESLPWNKSFASFGSGALIDLGEPDVRIGLSYPALFAWVGWNKANGFSFLDAAAGLSILGLKLTVGDVLYAEARFGAVQYGRSAWMPEGGSAHQQEGFGFKLDPRIKVGLAF